MMTRHGMQSMYIVYRSFCYNAPNLRPKFTDGFISETKWFESREKFMSKVSTSLTPPINQTVSVTCNNQEELVTWEKFSDINNLDIRLEKALSALGHSNMSAIQKHTFDILNRRTHDVLASAETGSGKTLAFLAPIVNRLLKCYPEEAMKSVIQSDGRVKFPLFLIVAPTRELVNQICYEAVQLTNFTYFRFCNVIGGVNVERQKDMMRLGCQALVATPGRLIDLLSQGFISMRHCDSIVFDEADRMLDMGFEPQINQIMNTFDMPKSDKLQLSMFSATFPDEVMDLVSNTLKPDYAKILIGSNAGSSVPTIPSNISQTFQLSERTNIYIDVINFLKQIDKKTLVFCNTRKDVKLLENMSYRNELRATYLSGDLKQNARDYNLNEFKKNRANIMFATSVAARGLDVSDIECVVNVNMPSNIDDYIHRAGRCGRMGRVGMTKTFFIDGSVTKPMLKDLKAILKTCNQNIPHEILECKYSADGDSYRFGSSNNNRGGYGRDNYNRGGYNRDNFNRGGYGRDNYNRGGYNRDNYDRVDGGYGRDNFKRGGYNRGNLNRVDGGDDRGYQSGFGRGNSNDQTFNKRNINDMDDPINHKYNSFSD